MNIKQRESALQKFWKAQISTANGCDPPDLSTQDEVVDSELQEQNAHLSGADFSVQPEDSGLAGIPLLLLKEMYSQAAKLIENKEAVIQPPSSQHNAFVVKTDVGGKPHYVYQEVNGKVVCDECPRYKLAEICCHALAVTKKCGGLSKYLSRYKRSSQTITATSYITRNSSKTVGKKGSDQGKSTARRRGGRSKDT